MGIVCEFQSLRGNQQKTGQTVFLLEQEVGIRGGHSL